MLIRWFSLIKSPSLFKKKIVTLKNASLDFYLFLFYYPLLFLEILEEVFLLSVPAAETRCLYTLMIN